MSQKKPTKKQQLQEHCRQRGIAFAQRDTIADLEAKLAGRSSGSRSAALSQSAPTVRMRVDARDLQPQRRPGSADILAVALVVFMVILAAGGTTLEKLRNPTGTVPPVPVVAHA